MFSLVVSPIYSRFTVQGALTEAPDCPGLSVASVVAFDDDSSDLADPSTLQGHNQRLEIVALRDALSSTMGASGLCPVMVTRPRRCVASERGRLLLAWCVILVHHHP